MKINNFMLVMGDKEVEDGTLSVRKRGFGDLGAMKIEEFEKMILEQNASKEIF